MRQPRKTGGFPWVLFGCLTAIAVFVFLVLAGYVAARYAIGGLIGQYTDTAPMELPPSTMSTQDYAALEERVNEFRKAIDDGMPTKALELSADDINALIQHDPEWDALKGRVHVSIENDLIKGTVSMPLDMFNLKGRYLNGSGTFSVFLRNGMLFVQLDALEVRGKSLPEDFMRGLRSENLAKQYNQDPQARERLSQFESIEVQDGILHITGRKTT